MSVLGIGKRGLGGAGAAALVVLLSACGSGSSSATPAAGPESAPAQGKPPVTVAASTLKTMSTSIGTVLASPSDRAVYELVGDSAAHPRCTGGCLAIWPPVMKHGRPVIVNGHPAYTYVRDTAAGQASGQNVTDQWGLWLALDASGNPIKASGASTPSPSAPSSKASAPNGGTAAF
jgi:predicted lipoprotein with Yx(FWY)xxD motif